MSSEVNIESRNFGKAEKELGRKVVNQVIRRTVQVGTIAVLVHLRQRSVALDIRHRYRFAMGWAAKAIPRGVVVYNRAKHAIFIEHGRRPGKQPPVAPILEWVRYRARPVVSTQRRGGITVVRRGGRSRLENARSAAFLIARAIGRRGIKPRRVLTDPKTQAWVRRQYMDRLEREFWKASVAAFSKQKGRSRG